MRRLATPYGNSVDLHCHLLPAVDDGPKTVAESLAYAAEIVRTGTTTVVATPHLERVDVTTLGDRVADLRQAFAEERIQLDVLVGGELKPESIGRMSDRELRIVAQGPPHARWILLEAPFRGLIDAAFHEGCSELHARGFDLLIAHPERSRDVSSGGLEALRPLLFAGDAVAMNIGPLSGFEGAARAAAARQLLDMKMATILATDAHPPLRPNTLEMGRRALVNAGVPSSTAWSMTSSIPARMLSQGLPARWS